MSLKIGDKVKGVEFQEGFKGSGLHFNSDMQKHVGKIGIVLEHTHFLTFRAVRLEFENGDQWVYPEEVLTVINEKEKIVKKQKSVSEFKVAAYAVVNTETGEVLGITYKRSEAREELQALKNHPRDNIKVIKLQPQKFIR